MEAKDAHSGVGVRISTGGNLRRCRVENEPPSLGGVVELGPGVFDLHEFPEALFAEGLNGYVVAGLFREGAVLGETCCQVQARGWLSETVRQVSQR